MSSQKPYLPDHEKFVRSPHHRFISNKTIGRFFRTNKGKLSTMTHDSRSLYSLHISALQNHDQQARKSWPFFRT